MEPKIVDNNSYQKYFIYAGRVTIDKGIDYLIEEWKTLGLNDYKLKIIGEGPLKKNLYSDNNVEILNPVSNDEIIKLINTQLLLLIQQGFTKVSQHYFVRLRCKKVSIFPNYGGINEFFPENYPFVLKITTKGLWKCNSNSYRKSIIGKKYENLNFQYLKSKLDQNN